MHRVLREALQQGVRWQMFARNPADAVKPPKVESKQMSVLDTDAAADLIEAARPYRIFVPSLLGGVACEGVRSPRCDGGQLISTLASSLLWSTKTEFQLPYRSGMSPNRQHALTY